MHHEFEDEIWPALYERVPAFEAIKVVNSWAGHYDFCVLDHNVIVGPHDEVANFASPAGSAATVCSNRPPSAPP